MPKRRSKQDNGNTKPAQAKSNGNGANLGFESQMFLAADKLRKNLEPSDYKHVALGLIFLKHISNAFETKRAALLADDPAAAEDPDEYLAEKSALSLFEHKTMLQSLDLERINAAAALTAIIAGFLEPNDLGNIDRLKD